MDVVGPDGDDLVNGIDRVTSIAATKSISEPNVVSRFKDLPKDEAVIRQRKMTSKLSR